MKNLYYAFFTHLKKTATLMGICIGLLLLSGGPAQAIPLNEAQPESLAVRMAESVMARHGGAYSDWNYVSGTVLRGFIELWHETGEQEYYDYIKQTVDAVVNSDGSIDGYNMSDFNIDEIKEGSIVLFLYEQTGESKYETAANTLREQLLPGNHPRTSEGGFWHKERYPHQMWLDGLYMGSPFLAQYGEVFNEDTCFTDVVNQLGLMEIHGRDPNTGLLYHGWDESREQDWADPVTGQSPNFWGRGIGWYAMALVDVLDYLPETYAERDSIIHITQRLAEAVFNFQDQDSGLWWQVVDQGNREGNYLESSAATMFTYAFAKAVRKGYISTDYKGDIMEAYRGIAEEFTVEQSDRILDLIQTCCTAGLGYGRDGSYEYYVYETEVCTNDGKAVGPFINAALELWRAKQVIAPPENLQIEQNDPGEVDINWNDASDNETGFILQRASGGEYQNIATIGANTTQYTDATVEPITEYSYRLVSYTASDTSYPSFSQTIITLNSDGSPSPATEPVPADSSTDIPLMPTLEWTPGAGVSSHDVYFGIENPPAFAANITEAYFGPDTLLADTTYYWRVNEVNDSGTTQGPVWQFHTVDVIGPQLVGYWALDQSQGEVAVDSSEFGNNGTLVNLDDSAWSAGISGNALTFSGTDKYVEVPHDQAFNFGANQSFTIAFWLKQSAENQAQRYVIKGTHSSPGTGKRYEIFHHQDNQIRFSIDDDVTKSNLVVNNDEFVTGEWEHIAAVRDRSAEELYLYLNGKRWGTAQDNTGDISQDENLFFGISPDEDNTTLQGQLDEIRLYSYALSQSQVQNLYNRDATSIRARNDGLPTRLTLGSYPNPFNATATIEFALPQQSNVSVSVYDIRGKLVRTLLRENRMQAGVHHVWFDASALSSGMYFYVLDTGSTLLSKKTVLLK